MSAMNHVWQHLNHWVISCVMRSVEVKCHVLPSAEFTLGYADSKRSKRLQSSRRIASTANSVMPASATSHQWSGSCGTTGTSAKTAPDGPKVRPAGGDSRARHRNFRCA